MLGNIYDTIATTVLIIGSIGVALGIAKGICNTRLRSNPRPRYEKYTVEIEITDPMVVSEIQTLKQLQEVYNAQISQQNEKHQILDKKYESIMIQISEQQHQMEYASQIGEIKVSKNLYESKIAELSESSNELMGQMLKIEEKILKLTKQSDGITAKLNDIGVREYKRQNS